MIEDRPPVTAPRQIFISIGQQIHVPTHVQNASIDTLKQYPFTTCQWNRITCHCDECRETIVSLPVHRLFRPTRQLPSNQQCPLNLPHYRMHSCTDSTSQYSWAVAFIERNSLHRIFNNTLASRGAPKGPQLYPQLTFIVLNRHLYSFFLFCYYN